ncbi:MAG: DNA-methyltransferase [Candidatus Helarchaeota archaeon]
MGRDDKYLKIERQTVYFKSSELMDELTDESIDVIITSPPYNRGKKYSDDNDRNYNDNRPDDEYYPFLERVWRECHRVARKSAILFLNIGDAAIDQGKSELVANSAVKAGWVRIQDIAWIKSFLGKGHYTPSGGNRRLNNIWEHVFMFAKDRKAYSINPKAIGIPYADKSNIGRYGNSDLRDAGNVWLIPYQKTTGASIKKGHDAPFPIGLPYRCLKLVPNVKYVLDPFGGTCTTLAACVYLKLEGVAYEQYPRIEVIKKRILEGKSFKPMEFPLIPHLELSVRMLTKILSQASVSVPIPKNKKDLVNHEIIKNTCSILEIENDFTKRIDEILKQIGEETKETNSSAKRIRQKNLSSLLKE